MIKLNVAMFFYQCFVALEFFFAIILSVFVLDTLEILSWRLCDETLFWFCRIFRVSKPPTLNRSAIKVYVIYKTQIAVWFVWDMNEEAKKGTSNWSLQF